MFAHLLDFGCERPEEGMTIIVVFLASSFVRVVLRIGSTMARMNEKEKEGSLGFSRALVARFLWSVLKNSKAIHAKIFSLVDYF